MSHDQRSNAYAYAGTGAAVVLEEGNMTPHVLVSEVKRLTGDPELLKKMTAAAATFTTPDAAHLIASEITAIALSHEPQDAPTAS